MKNSSKPLRLIHCTNEIGEGGGIATINGYFNRFLNRDIFDPGLAGSGQDKPFSDSIKYLGFRPDVHRIYKGADLLINLSRKESFGLVAIEAMASGCLVVGSDDGGMSEVISDSANGWLVDGKNRTLVRSTINNAIQTRQTSKWNTMRLSAVKP